MPRTCSAVPPSNKPQTATPIIRPAAIGDVPDLHHLLETYANMGNLLPRAMSELYRHLRDFFVVELDGAIAACGALEIFTEDLGEIRSLVVADRHVADRRRTDDRRCGLWFVRQGRISRYRRWPPPNVCRK